MMGVFTRVLCAIVQVIFVLTVTSEKTTYLIGNTWASTRKENTQDFATWLEDLKIEAQKAWKIRPEVLERALADVQPLPCVIELDRRQPERTLTTFQAYRTRMITGARIAAGRERIASYRQLLGEIGRLYGVQPRFIVALWGIETNFGLIPGQFLVVNALATLAYDSRRSTYFRQELFQALTILHQGHITPERMRGSWAGAMGQNQFMPSSFLRFARDYDGDGHSDIWSTEADIFASTANYLATAGWKSSQSWGQEVCLPEGFDSTLASTLATRKTKKSLSEWATLGLIKANGCSLPDTPLSARLILPDSSKGSAFLLFDNYDVLLKWNRSHWFALAVGHLADRLQGQSVLRKEEVMDERCSYKW